MEDLLSVPGVGNHTDSVQKLTEKANLLTMHFEVCLVHILVQADST